MPYRIAILEAGDVDPGADPDEVRTIMDTDPGVQARGLRRRAHPGHGLPGDALA